MGQKLVIQGVPDRIRLDGWWLETSGEHPASITNGSRDSSSAIASLRMQHKIPLLAALVAVADWLFWHQPLGVSIAVFMLLLSVAILAVKSPRPSVREAVGAMAFATLSNVPLCIDLQFLSVLFSLGGLACMATWLVYRHELTERLLLRTAVYLPTVGAFLLGRFAMAETSKTDLGAGFRGTASHLALPCLVGAVFLLLLAEANPVLENMFAELDLARIFEPEFWLRLVFWCAFASWLWPYLNLSKSWLGPVVKRAAVERVGPGRVDFLVNPVSVRNSLVLFNLMFLVQSVMDLGVLTGGVSLPEGMSYASYAHRGAYPLVVTALLAGVFAIATHRMIGADRILRLLVFLWLGQNLFLVVTAAVRLQLYVEAYALTYLRVAAFIWMGLVFVGLLLTAVQIHRGLSNAWLVRRCFFALGVTLYLCCFVNFAQLIASHNLRHGETLAERDTAYICALGADAYPAIHAFEVKTGQQVCGDWMQYKVAKDAITNWREWGFRRWRIQAYYQQHN